jgi:hypothetical protein
MAGDGVVEKLSAAELSLRPQQRLYLRPLPQGHGALRAGAALF